MTFSKWVAMALLTAIITTGCVCEAVRTEDTAETVTETTTQGVGRCTELETTQVETTTETTTEIVETTETTTEMTETVEVVEVRTHWEHIPLDADVQEHIVTLCEQRDIDPMVVFAIIWRESRFDVGTMGDNGNAYGLMQIQQRWHVARMEKLGCFDLMNPLQNVTVGIDYLDEMIDKYDSLEMGLIAYNCGATGAYNNFFKYGVYSSQYSADVLAAAERMKTNVPT